MVSPSSVARTLGSRVTLTCRAEGNPPPSYTWGASHTPGVLGSQPKMTLDISPATVGSYFCTARGAQGREVVSAPAVVALVGVPSITETGVEEGGDESALHCSVRGQKVSVSWRREREEIVPGGRYMVVTEVRGEEVQSWLTVKEPEEVDFGEYYCVVRWQGGELEKRLVLLPGGQAELVVLQVLLVAPLSWPYCSSAGVAKLPGPAHLPPVPGRGSQAGGQSPLGTRQGPHCSAGAGGGRKVSGVLIVNTFSLSPGL